MATLEQRRGKATSASPRSSSPSHRSRSSSSSDLEDEAQQLPDSSHNSDSDGGPGRRSNGRKLAEPRGGGGGGLSSKAALDFVQLLVFLVVMLQALTLFVSYHSLLAGQHAAKVDAGLQSGVAQLHQSQLRIEARLEQMALDARTNAAAAAAAVAAQRTAAPVSNTATPSATKRATPVATASLGASAAADGVADSSDFVAEEVELVEAGSAEEEQHQQEEQPQEEEAEQEEQVEAVDVSSLYKDASGHIDPLKLDDLIGEAHRARLESLGVALEGDRVGEMDRPVSGAVVDPRGGNRLMQLTPRDMELLRSDWVNSSSSSGGEGLSPTESLLRSLGQSASVSPGGTTHDVSVVEPHRSHRFVVAARPIRAGEYFFRIPQRALLTSLVAEHSHVGQALHQSEVEIDELVFTVIYILDEKLRSASSLGQQDPSRPAAAAAAGGSGRFRDWIASLPLDYSSMPVTMDSGPAALGLIEGTLALEVVREYQQLYRQEFLTLRQALAARRPAWTRGVSFAAYVWARLVVSSRAFGIDIHRVKRDENGRPVRASVEDSDSNSGAAAPVDSSGLVLEPLHLTAMCAADLLDHQGETHKIDAIWGWNEATKEFAFKASRDIPRGAMIHTTYGPRGNTDLFAHYGFTLAHNPFNFGPLCIPLREGQGQGQEGGERLRALRDAFAHGSDGDAAWEKPSCLGMQQEQEQGQAPAGRAPAPVFRCRLHQDLLEEQSVECFALLRALLAPPRAWEALVRPRIAADAAARVAHAAGNVDEDKPAASIIALEAIDYDTERLVVRRIGEHAARSLSLIAGGPLSNDTSILGAHVSAKAAGSCAGAGPGDAASSAPAAAWFPRGPCLTPNQWNLVQARLGEKAALQNAVDLAAALERFHAARHASLRHAYAFLDSLVPADAELARLAAEDATPNWTLLAYFNEELLPLFVRDRAQAEAAEWTATPEFLAEKERLYAHYRKMYQSLSKEQLEEQEHRLHSFGYGEDEGND